MNDSLSRFLEGFSFPGVWHDESFHAELAVAHAREVLERMLQLHSAAFASLDPACPDAVQMAASGPLSFDDVWCLPIGAAWANLRSDPRYPVDQVVTLLADWATSRLAVSGVDNEYFPSGQRYDGTSTATQIIRGTFHVKLRYEENLYLVCEEFLRAQALSCAEHESVNLLMHDAFDIIDRFAPEFSSWTLRLLREVIPIVTSSAHCLQSGSSASEPGRCHMSMRNGPVALAEMLVHETTHQYYYLVTRLGPVDNGTDTELYYSPVKNCGRPIHYILIAYHAFANVLLFSQRCLAAGYNDSDGYLNRNVRILTEWVKTLDASLRRTTALTTIGKGLWLPLASQLNDSNTMIN